MLDDEEAARRRRRQIFWIMKMKEQGMDKKPRTSTLRQEHDLFKTREARREARNAQAHSMD